MTRSRLATCPPAWGTRRRKGWPTWGPKVGEIQQRLSGKPFMPHQQHILDVSLEIDPTNGELWYRDITVTLPRQNGKTTITLPRVIWRAEAAHLLGGRQAMLYTSTTGTAAKAKWEKEFVEELDASPVMAGRYRTIRQPNHERIRFRTGSTFGPIAPTATAGHGDVLDDGTYDETFAAKDDRVEQAWEPAMLTRHQSQFWTPSTAGKSTVESPYLWGRVAAGRKLCEEPDPESRSAHFEWACPPDLDIENPENWWEFMPALGYTIRVQTIQHRLGKMLRDPEEGLPGFRRAYGNQWSDQYDDAEWILPKLAWLKCTDTESKRVGKPAIAIDISPDRGMAAIGYCAVRGDGLPMVEVVKQGAGSSWLIDEAVSMANAKGATCIVLDGAGPAANKEDELRKRVRGGCKVVTLDSPGMADAWSDLFDATITEQVRHIGQKAVADALKNAEQIPVGDRWKAGRRKSDGDITSGEVVAMAYEGLKLHPGKGSILW
jgi:hypothetical protein